MITGTIANRPVGDIQWYPTDEQATPDECRKIAMAHNDADCCEPDYEPLEWAIITSTGDTLVCWTAA